MRIGVVSDTHGYLDPHLPPLLQGVDEILHAGDVGSQLVLDQLRVLAPTRAVRGNADAALLNLPPALTRWYADVEIHMLHELPKPQSVLREWVQGVPHEGKPAPHYRRFLQSLPESCQVVIFGHSHEPCALILDGKLFLNPGSAGKKRFSLPRCFGILEISASGVRATFLGLESYNKDLPADAWLPIEGA